MGFLSINTLRALACAALIASGTGCSHRWSHEFTRDPGTDWTMYGGDIGRSNRSLDSIRLPLAVKWEYDAGSGFGTSAACLMGSTLFVGTLTGEVHAISTTTGEEFASYDFGSSIVGSPAMDEYRLYVPLTGDEYGLIAYDLREARVAWKLKIPDVDSSPLLLDSTIVVATLRNGIVCADKVTGTILWRFELPGRTHRPMIHSSPASDGTVIVFGCDDGSLYAIDAASGSQRWRASTGGAILSSLTIDAGKVYVGSLDRNFYAFDLADGKTLWTRSLGASIVASQAVDERCVFVGTAGRTMFALEKTDGTVRWQFTSGGSLNAPPGVSDGVLFFGSIDRWFYALNSASGELLWKYEMPGRVRSAPVVRRHRVFVPVDDSMVFSFGPEFE